MSHEIRTPLNGIICGMNLLAESKLSAEQYDLLRTTLICSEQLLYVINDILGAFFRKSFFCRFLLKIVFLMNFLDITKMEENKMRLDLSTLSMSDIVSDSLSMVISSAESKGLALQSWTDPRIPEKLVGDSARLRMLFLETVFNKSRSNSGQSAIECCQI